MINCTTCVRPTTPAFCSVVCRIRKAGITEGRTTAIVIFRNDGRGRTRGKNAPSSPATIGAPTSCVIPLAHPRVHTPDDIWIGSAGFAQLMCPVLVQRLRFPLPKIKAQLE